MADLQEIKKEMGSKIEGLKEITEENERLKKVIKDQDAIHKEALKQIENGMRNSEEQEKCKEILQIFLKT